MGFAVPAGLSAFGFRVQGSGSSGFQGFGFQFKGLSVCVWGLGISGDAGF